MIRRRLSAIFFGPQGCGKGTQGQLLADRFGIPNICSGDLFRQEIEGKSALGRLVQQYVSAGMLAPDEFVNAVVQKRLKHLDLGKGFILDGYPRNVEQAEFLDRFQKITLALQIKISDEEALRRLQGRRQCPSCRSIFHIKEVRMAIPNVCALCGGKLIKREDDEDEVIRHRLLEYHFMTEPMAAYYRQRGILLVVQGAQSIASLFEEIVRKLDRLGFVALCQ